MNNQDIGKLTERCRVNAEVLAPKMGASFEKSINNRAPMTVDGIVQLPSITHSVDRAFVQRLTELQHLA